MRVTEYISFFGTKNIQRNRAFYETALELKIYKDQGKCLIYQVTETAKLGFCSHMEITAHKKSPIITFVIEDVDSYFELLKQRNLNIKSKPKLNEFFKIYHFFIEDPDGYTIEFQKFI